MNALSIGLKTIVLTTVAMIAFAANSVICRKALGTDAIDAVSFSTIRLVSGALVLFILTLKKGHAQSAHRSWVPALMLMLYAFCFSFAYLTLDTGTGALILFGSVQITMILVSWFAGNRLSPWEWIGLLLAFGGFVYLILPGIHAPPILGFVLMALAGYGWGMYSLKGRGSQFPLIDTSLNFLRTVPLSLVLMAGFVHMIDLSRTGILLAVLSGAVTSGIGYAIWYAALRGLTATRAAVVQLSVPIIAALGGVLFVGESIGWRLALSTTLILGGILVVIMGRQR
ncbi:MAG: DMT family transporter [Acidobacteria bacterium]|nr:DMT family transporter [Acidobacteriota bacterium]